MKKVIHMVTIARSFNLMSGQITFLKNAGFNIGVLSSPGKELDEQDAKFIKGIKMEREISIVKDIKSLLKLIAYFRVERPDAVNAGTPKAGLLGMLASYIVRVPNRIYTMRGLRLETEIGIKRKILWCTEKISCMLATEVICISPSLLEEAKKLNLLTSKGIVLGKGSSNGLNIKKYPLPNSQSIINFKSEFYSKFNISNNDFILGFVGRLTKDKGINELLEVYKDLEAAYNDIKLIILGEFEDGLDEKSINYIIESPKIIHLGYISEPIHYFYLFDVMLFPTHREGFGNVSIQAQAASVPVITTNVTGAKDTIINNKSGILYPAKNKESLKSSILYLYKRPQIAHKYGNSGRTFVKNNFQSVMIWKELVNFYERILK